MGLLAGEELTIIKGDIDQLKELTEDHIKMAFRNRDDFASSINLINTRLDSR